MYNKLFTKILDSSIWLEPTPTRIVWVTFLAAMDETGFVQFAAVGNVASRARVTLEEAQAAIHALETPDPESSDPDHEGRRIERVPGGWMVLNAEKHRALVTRAITQERTRDRVRKHRELKRAEASKKRTSNAAVTPSEAEAETEAETEAQTDEKKELSIIALRAQEGFAAFWAVYPRRIAKASALKAWLKLKPSAALQATILAAVTQQRTWEAWLKDGGAFIPHPATWLNAGRWDDQPTEVAVSLVSDVTRQNQRNAEIYLASVAKGTR